MDEIRRITAMAIEMMSAVAVAAALGATPMSEARAADDVIRIGFVTDLSGPYEEVDGHAGAEAIRMAIAKVGGTAAGKRVEMTTADHHNDVNVAVGIARDWFDKQGVDVLIGGVNSDTGLAMAKVATERRKPFIAVGSGTSEHTNEQCSPYVVQWAYDTVAQGKVIGEGVTRHGGRSWYFLTADYPFGSQLQSSAVAAAQAAGGKIVGVATHPHEAHDFAPFVKQAASSGATTLGLANGHTDLINAVKSANSLGASAKMRVAGAFVFVTELHALGLAAAQGMFVADSWFWTRDADTRAWSRGFFDRFGRMPSSLHAADYSAALQYLSAVEAIGSKEPDAVLQQMKRARINDIFAKGGYIRDDGRMVHDMYLLQVKSPEQSSHPWDYYNLVEVFKGDAAWTTKAESRCVRWK
jgi:branched-chain amino acid transport system substrate-binding protein